MSYIFADGFDLYTTTTDVITGYWDGGSSTSFNLVSPGRFAGSQAIGSPTIAASSWLSKNGANDAVHHITCAFKQATALSGTLVWLDFRLSDGATSQCSIVFRSDGTILLTSGISTGTTLATYTGAVTGLNVWFAFEFEVIIHPTAGRFRVRKNGNPVDDFDSGAVLNTRPGANTYANRLSIGLSGNAGSNGQQIDDLLWRSDAASVPWIGDVRCYPRMPVSDASTQFARAPTTFTQLTVAGGSFDGVVAGMGRYVSFIPANSGNITTVTVPFQAATTCNMKCSIFASAAGVPGAVLGSATPVALTTAILGTFTFGTPVAVIKGTPYWIGFDADATSGNFNCASGQGYFSSTTSYASFPAASPAVVPDQGPAASFITAATINAEMVCDPQQDGTTSYVYDAVAGHADFYNIAPITTPSSAIVALTTRGFMAKGDAGTRAGAVQLKSGASTVAAPTLNLSTSFLWSFRTDTVNPATGTAWTDATANAATAGPVVIA